MEIEVAAAIRNHRRLSIGPGQPEARTREVASKNEAQLLSGVERVEEEGWALESTP